MVLIAEADKFHDWVLQNIFINWEMGGILINLEFDKKYQIEIINFSGCTIPRKLPWGKSKHIYEVEEFQTQNKSRRLRILMQSGDYLEFEGSELKVVEVKS